MIDIYIAECQKITAKNSRDNIPLSKDRIYRDMLKTCYADIQNLKSFKRKITKYISKIRGTK
jgi:hypothetical protein